MTHSNGKTHEVGDHGQRFEVSFYNSNSNVRDVLGWVKTIEDAVALTVAIDRHPCWFYPWITDRQANTVPLPMVLK